MNNKKKKIFTIREVLFLVLLTLLAGFIMGFSFNNINENDLYKNEEANELISNYNYILENYNGKIEKTDLLTYAIDGMLTNLNDKYSTIIEEENIDNFNSLIIGSYEGFGIVTYELENKVLIYNIYKDSEAEKNDLKIGDNIIKIDEYEINNISDMNEYINDNEKSSYKLTIVRNEGILTKEIKLSTITIESVDHEIIDNIGYMHINLFADNTYEQFNDSMLDFENNNITDIIIDVRNNYGGKLTSVENILSYFIEKDELIYMLDTKGVITEAYSTGIDHPGYNIVILQNELTASGAEMLSGALKEQYNATVIGTTSYGKGTVQNLVTVNNYLEYKLTIREWLTPLGKQVNEIGIIPDIEIEQEYEDKQLEEAIKYIKG